MTKTDHNLQKKIALINDYSGFGRCSVAVQLPLISAMKVQCCPLPTAIFSNHTGFPDFCCRDFTDDMQEYISMWRQLDLRFDGICTGFLGSERQIDIVSGFIRDFKNENTLVLVDPVMGDYGRTYATYTAQMCLKMKSLARLADILTPNLTEACILTDTPYKERWKRAEIEKLIKKVAAFGAKKTVITGIPQKSFVCNLCYDSVSEEIYMIKTHRIGTTRSGTGDVFSAILAAAAVRGMDFKTSVRKASSFIKKCILKAEEMDIPVTDGVPFEEIFTSFNWN